MIVKNDCNYEWTFWSDRSNELFIVIAIWIFCVDWLCDIFLVCIVTIVVVMFRNNQGVIQAGRGVCYDFGPLLLWQCTRCTVLDLPTLFILPSSLDQRQCTVYRMLWISQYLLTYPISVLTKCGDIWTWFSTVFINVLLIHVNFILSLTASGETPLTSGIP